MSDPAPEAEPKENWDEKVEKILSGAEALNTVREGAELLGLLEGAAEAGGALATLSAAACVIGPIVALVGSLYSILEADATEEKLAGARGFAYGVIWGVLGKGTPSAKCGGPNELFPDRVQSEQEKWDAGAKEGAAKGAEQSFRNRCLIFMAKNNDESGDQMLRHFFTDAAEHLGTEGTISALAGNLTVDSPCC